jgi:hypothetical protein
MFRRSCVTLVQLAIVPFENHDGFQHRVPLLIYGIDADRARNRIGRIGNPRQVWSSGASDI